MGVVADINTFQDSQNNTYFIGLSYKQFYVIIEAYIIIIIIIILYDEETFFFSFLIAITCESESYDVIFLFVSFFFSYSYQFFCNGLGSSLQSCIEISILFNSGHMTDYKCITWASYCLDKMNPRYANILFI